MRVISQNGNVDLPYEQTQILRSNEYVMAKIGEKEYTMAKYSNMNKAYKAMEMLRNAYIGIPVFIQNIDIDESALELLKKWKTQGIIVATKNNEPSKAEVLNCRIFRFPKDYEV